MTGAVARIVVLLDAASENHAAIGTAARLAGRWAAHLHGVFVEDDDLIRLAHLPFARQVTLGAGVEALTLREAEHQLRVFAARAREELAAAAQRHGVAWSFEIVRDGSSDGLSAAPDDFLVACTATRPIGGHFRVECRWWWNAAASGPSARLLAHREGDPYGAVAALIHDRDAAAERLVAAALRLAEANDAALAVICPPALAQQVGFKTWLDQQLAGHPVAVDIELLRERAPLHRHIAELRCRLVAIHAEAEEASPDRLRELIATVACDVLVVR
ncbi:MAG TPA: hypothetical protein VG651_09135 [Stellaceae bacterium]|nr:hypothetical protein [Stellaceae bacterium]